jgi:hypothetical protein
VNEPTDPRHDPAEATRLDRSRRYFLGRCTGVGLGAMALGLMEAASGARAARGTPPGSPGLPHFAPRARRVIFLTQSGGPSQIELFDHKPGLPRWAGKELPESVRQGQRVTTMTANQKQLIMPPAPASPGTARAARPSGNGSRTCPAWSTTSASSNPWSPTRSTTPRP